MHDLHRRRHTDQQGRQHHASHSVNERVCRGFRRHPGQRGDQGSECDVESADRLIVPVIPGRADDDHHHREGQRHDDRHLPWRQCSACNRGWRGTGTLGSREPKYTQDANRQQGRPDRQAQPPAAEYRHARDRLRDDQRDRIGDRGEDSRSWQRPRRPTVRNSADNPSRNASASMIGMISKYSDIRTKKQRCRPKSRSSARAPGWRRGLRFSRPAGRSPRPSRLTREGCRTMPPRNMIMKIRPADCFHAGGLRGSQRDETDGVGLFVGARAGLDQITRSE